LVARDSRGSGIGSGAGVECRNRMSEVLVKTTAAREAVRSNAFRAALFVPDGVGIRNFVLGSFLQELARRAQVDLFHILPEDLAARYAAASPAGVDWQPLPALKQGRTISLLQSSLAYAHMY